MLLTFARCGANIFLLLTSLTLFAQNKVEVERSVSASQVPSAARDWLSEMYASTSQVHWYLEKSSDGTSYEAKLRQRGAWHSVEFGEDGTLQDVEITFELNNLPESVRQGMEAYFDTAYAKHRIRKIQQQLTGPPDMVRAVVHGNSAKGVTYRYEAEFYGKNDQDKALWEGLFDDQGQLLERRRIVLRPTDNLVY